ncbi:MAG: cytochrome C [Planctomycetes bacterium]|nr:cytochrome C [Planctomycetota bacterium]
MTILRILVWVLASVVLCPQAVFAHIVPPENLHPVAESYRRTMFILNLNPVVWEQVSIDVDVIADYWRGIDPEASGEFQLKVHDIIGRATVVSDEERGIEPMPRKEAAAQVFALLTRAVNDIARQKLVSALDDLGSREATEPVMSEARAIFAAYDDVLRATDPVGFRQLGQQWLDMATALGTPGLLGVRMIQSDHERIQLAVNGIIGTMNTLYGDFEPVPGRALAPWPVNSPTFDAHASLPIKLPPGNNINKQIPRPRQILNIVARGVDERETPLIALGDMAFDSAYIFGEPMRTLGMSCNTCHNKSITNPDFFIPGLSSRPGGFDVSNSYLAPHANNGIFDPLDIPDLRGIRFTAPYGRNGRFGSLREFVRNGIVNEFNGPEPDPILLDGLIAYMNEFDFLSNPALDSSGVLNDRASQAARRGEKIFNTPYRGMADRSCASCHVPSSHFLDRQRHDIGTVQGFEANSLDRAMDTPTLLGITHTAPYFHDGSQPTLRAVNEWFNETYAIGLSESELSDLTAYVETVGDGVEPYEDTIYYLDAEMEEFSFFLSAFDFLEAKNKPELINTTFQTIALEIRNHKWELQDYAVMPVMDRLAEIMDEAYEANVTGQRGLVREKVNEYRELYAANVDRLK